jgi:hypothetical protein
MKGKFGLVAVLVLIATVAFGSEGAVGAAGTRVVVSPTDTHGWTFVTETPTGTGALVNGPGSPPLGTGSVQLTVDSTGREIATSQTYPGIGARLTDMSALQYSTYTTASGPANAYDISLQFDMYDPGTPNPIYAGRAVYEPYQNGAVAAGQWQTWNPLQGVWWQSHTMTGPCSQSAPCSWSTLVGMFPNARLGAAILRAGGPWPPGFTGNADALTIGVNGFQTTTYDFESFTLPNDKDQCKNDGYKNFTDPSTGQPFKNQGQCVSSAVHQSNGGKDDNDGGNGHHGSGND